MEHRPQGVGLAVLGRARGHDLVRSALTVSRVQVLDCCAILYSGCPGLRVMEIRGGEAPQHSTP